MNINNPPVFNRIIASGGEIGTVAVSGKSMQWQFDGVDASVDTVIASNNDSVKTFVGTVIWPMQGQASVTLGLPVPQANILDVNVSLDPALITGTLTSNPGVLFPTATVVTAGVITHSVADVGMASEITLFRENNSEYNGPSYISVTVTVVARYFE